jgi:hypothetical protein
MSVPVPPVRDARGTRHTMPVVRRAVELHRAGWTPTEIRRRLEEELGVTAGDRDDPGLGGAGVSGVHASPVERAAGPAAGGCTGRDAGSVQGA